MSEVQSRPARGRSTARGGGRGGHGSRGPRSNKQTNGDHVASNAIDTSADQGELGELKRRYQSQLTTLKELFPDWADADLVLAVEESDGDLSTTIEKISEGAVSQFTEIKKPKDRSRSKVKDTPIPTDATPSTRGIRGDRGERRGGDSVRGGRGRGTERGRGGFRGSVRGSSTNGTRTGGTTSVPTTESPVWSSIPASSAEGKENVLPAATSPEPEAQKPAPVAAAPPAKTWASMFAKPKVAPIPKPVAQVPVVKDEAPAIPSEPPAHEVAQEAAIEAEELPIPPVADEVPEEPQVGPEEATASVPDNPTEAAVPDIELTPSKDELTKDNVEHLPDESHPPPTETAASTVASSRDIGVATPLSISHQAPIGRPAPGGFATTALKATGTPHRSASFQRRLMEQQEAVVLPGNHAVDRAAVQFGSLGIDGEVDTESLDVDEDREEAETRTQPPQHSPVAQPRASLPPVQRQAPPAAEAQPQETVPTPKQAPGLPPPPQQQSAPQQSTSEAHGTPSQVPSTTQSYNQFGRYGHGGIQTEAAAPQQKPYDPFGQQSVPTSQYEHLLQQQPQQQQQPQGGAFSTGSDSFASQYQTADQHRYQHYNYYGQQSSSAQQDAGFTQPRASSGFGANANESRYNEGSGSGHTTPNPVAGQGSQPPHLQQPGAYAGGYGGAYNHNQAYKFTNHPDYMAYMAAYYGPRGFPGYGGFAGAPSQYGQHSSYDQQHGSSPANVGGFASRDNGHGAGGPVDHTKPASSTSQNPSSHAGLSFEQYPRGSGGNSNYEETPGSYGRSNTGPGFGAPTHRPGSATNNAPGQGGQGFNNLQGGSGHHNQQQPPLGGGSYGNFGQGGNHHGNFGGFSGYGSFNGRGGPTGWGHNYNNYGH